MRETHEKLKVRASGIIPHGFTELPMIAAMIVNLRAGRRKGIRITVSRVNQRHTWLSCSGGCLLKQLGNEWGILPTDALCGVEVGGIVKIMVKLHTTP